MQMNLVDYFARSKFNRIRADFYEDLGEALDDDGELVPTLTEWMRRCAGRRKDQGLAAIYALWLRRMDSMTFAEAIAGTVPQMDAMILAASESSGDLAKGLRFLAKAVRISERMKEVIAKALTMPMLIAIVLSVVVTVFAYQLTPVLEQIYPVAEWPVAGKALYGLSWLATRVGPFALPLAIAVAIWFSWSLENWTGPVRKVLDQHLPYSLYRDYAGGIFLVTLASLMHVGNSMTEALMKMRESATPWLGWHIGQILRNLDASPDSPGRAMNTGVFSQELADRIESFGRRGDFREALAKVGLQGVDRVIKNTEQNAMWMNIACMFAGGIVVGTLLLGVVTTSIEADSAVKRQITRVQR